MAVATLGIGIGSATTIFALVNNVYLQPTPHDPDGRLVAVWETYPNWREQPVLARMWDRINLAWPDFQDWKENQTVYSDVAVVGERSMVLTGGHQALNIAVGVTSTSLFPMLGAGTVMGRTFLPGEEGPGAPGLVVLGHAIWTTTYGSDANIVGSTIVLNGDAFEVIGVLSSSFQWIGSGSPKDVWIPIGSDGAPMTPGNHSFQGFAKLRPGMTPELAVTETVTLLRGEHTPEARGARVLPLRDQLATANRGSVLLLLMAAVGILWLIAVASVGTLLIGELASRRHEMATRHALGAGRSRIARQILTETALLAGLGGGAGILFSIWALEALVAAAPAGPQLLASATFDGMTLGFACALTVAAAAVTWASSMIGARPSRIALGLRGTAGRGFRGRRIQNTMLATELALSVVLLTVSGLLARSTFNVMQVDPGLQHDGVVTFNLGMQGNDMSPAKRIQIANALQTRLAAIPGVSGVSATSALPFSGAGASNSIGVDGFPEGEEPEAERRMALPGYFSEMGIPLVLGRAIEGTDRIGTPPVVVINQAAADRFWPGESPLGKHITFEEQMEVVGVVGNVHHWRLTRAPEATFYIPHAQTPSTWLDFVLRASGDLDAVMSKIRPAVAAVDSDLPVQQLATVSSLVERSTALPRLGVTLITLFATMAALCTGVAIMGVTARAVRHRAKEMGIRSALGAKSSSLMIEMLRSTLGSAAVGILLGGLVVLGLQRVLSRMLFGISPWDPIAFGAVGGVLLLLVGGACYFPTRSVLRQDPAVVLRPE